MHACAIADKTCRIWDPHTGKLLATLEGHTKGVCDVAWAAMQNKFLCTGSDDKSVRVWDVETSECVKVLAAGTGDQDRGHTNYVMAVAFRAGADIIASASFDETAKLWNVQDARCVIDGLLARRARERSRWSSAPRLCDNRAMYELTRAAHAHTPSLARRRSCGGAVRAFRALQRDPHPARALGSRYQPRFHG